MDILQFASLSHVSAPAYCYIPKLCRLYFIQSACPEIAEPSTSLPKSKQKKWRKQPAADTKISGGGAHPAKTSGGGIHPAEGAMKRARTKKETGLPECCKRGCTNDAASLRAKFCADCFVKKARAANRKRKSFAGNTGAKGGIGNTGNTNVGNRKRKAGERSGLKRCAKYGLVVKKEWLDKILVGEKDWEIRGCATTRRGWVHLAQSRAGGTLVGRARLVDCVQIARSTFMKHVHHHCVPRLSMVPYKRIFAWVLEDAERFMRPLVYKHRQGAVIWTTVWGS